MIALSKKPRKTTSNDANHIYKRTFEDQDNKIYLFVRKNKDDKASKEFYYLGRMHSTGNAEEFTMPNTNKRAVEIEWKLDTPVREDIYQYIVNG